MLEQTKENLEKNGFEVIVVPNKWKAFEISRDFFKDGDSIGLGGSTTVEEIGLLKYICSLKENVIYNQYEEGITSEENTERRRKGMLADIYVTGCNAITVDGKLVNVDGSGNRVAAQIFGPKRVLVVAGTNKIVEDVEAGFKRIEEVVAPKNVVRLNAKAVEFGKEPTFTVKNISNKWCVIDSDVKGRTTIILIKEELGY